MKEPIMIAMSGGVDSSVCALLLKESGVPCRGGMMRLFSRTDPTVKKEDSLFDEEDAARIAQRLDIPFEVLDLSAEFRTRVIDYFVNTYLSGGTPNPCVVCNSTLKFGLFADAAMQKGCPQIATGHYAKILRDANGRYLLHRAKDASKDQSYVLWQLSQEQLSRTKFPLGELCKADIRSLAAEHGFCNAGRKDSQDICFIPDGDYVAFLERYTQKSFPEGDFTDLCGNLLGRHKGAVRYTVGQRKGLGIAFGKPTYVCGKDMKTNTVLLGGDEDLFHTTVTAHSINLIATDAIRSPIRAEAKLRYRAAPAACTVEQTDADRITVRFDTPQRAPAPGQSLVLYDGDCVIGGGVID